MGEIVEKRSVSKELRTRKFELCLELLKQYYLNVYINDHGFEEKWEEPYLIVYDRINRRSMKELIKVFKTIEDNELPTTFLERTLLKDAKRHPFPTSDHRLYTLYTKYINDMNYAITKYTNDMNYAINISLIQSDLCETNTSIFIYVNKENADKIVELIKKYDCKTFEWNKKIKELQKNDLIFNGKENDIYNEVIRKYFAEYDNFYEELESFGINLINNSLYNLEGLLEFMLIDRVDIIKVESATHITF